MTPSNSAAVRKRQNLPIARVEKLVVQEMENETLVYDLKTDKAHHLNKTMSVVWQKCDGKTSFDEVAKSLSKELDANIENDFVLLALQELEKSNLIESSSDESNREIISRRKVLLNYALPAVAAPLVMSLVSPVSAQTASCIAQESACDPPTVPGCCPGLNCTGFEGTCEAIEAE